MVIVWLLLALGVVIVVLFWKRISASWLEYVERRYRQKKNWKLLEVTIPIEVTKGPKAMEQVLIALHQPGANIIEKRFWFKGLQNIFSKIDCFLDQWIRGKRKEFSLELMGRAREVHSYIRVPGEYRNLVESVIYSQYPQAEIVEQNDYTEDFPVELIGSVYDLWSAEFVLAKDSVYPIKTYLSFEGKKGKTEVVDPLSHVFEVISELKKDEAIWLQMIIRPAPESFYQRGEKVIAELSKKKPPSKSPAEVFIDFLSNLIRAPFEPVLTEKEEKKKAPSLSQRERKIIEAIENKLSKLAYQVGIRFIYIDRIDAFTASNVSAVRQFFSLFSSLDLNAFKMKPISVKVPVTARKFLKRKREYLMSYKERKFPQESSILSTEELASIYHYPTEAVEVPIFRKKPKKAKPPSELPVM